MAHDLILGILHHHTNLRLPEPLRPKLARSSSGSTVGAAIVEAQCSLERDYLKTKALIAKAAKQDTKKGQYTAPSTLPTTFSHKQLPAHTSTSTPPIRTPKPATSALKSSNTSSAKRSLVLHEETPIKKGRRDDPAN
ncbi:putative Dip2-like domain-containing protein [Helianthus anomalus]